MSGKTLVPILLLIAMAMMAMMAMISTTEARDPAEVQAILDAAKSRGRSVDGQVAELIKLAWPPAEADFDAEVASRAREELVNYGADAFAGMRQAIRTVPRHQQADLIAALIEGRSRVTAGEPPQYLPALEDALWFGTSHTRRLVIPALTQARYPMALLTMMDAAYENPELRELIIRSLGELGNDRARHFLGEVLQGGSDEERRLAAWALMRIGERATATLFQATYSDDPATRSAAIRAVIPLSGTEEITVLYEYLAAYPDDDPELLRWVRQRAIHLERLLEEYQNAEVAVP